MNEIAENFNNNKQVLKAFVKDMVGYNEVLEDVIKTTIDAIATKFMGKEINKRFSNHVNAILAERYGVFENGKGEVSIEVEKNEWDDDRTINFGIRISKFYYRYNIKHVLTTFNKFYRNQYRQEATQDNRFNEESVKSLVEIININRARVATYQDAAKNFDKYIKIVEKLEKDVNAKLGKTNPLFYGHHINIKTFNTPNQKEFEEKMKQQGGTYEYELQVA